MSARIAALCVVAVTGLALTETAQSATIPPPPLRPGERIYVMANGCAVIFKDTTGDPAKLEESRKPWRTYSWKGECRNGLAHGKGTLYMPPKGDTAAFSMTQEYYFGRTIPIWTSYGKTWYYPEGEKAASATSDYELDRPAWRELNFSEGVPQPTEVVADNQSVRTDIESCYGASGCQPKYSIRSTMLVTDAPPALVRPCPNPHSPVGCEALWQEMAGPVIARFRELKARVESDYPAWRSRLAQLNAAREARIASVRAEAGAAMSRTQAMAEAEAEAEAGKADKIFAAKLVAANAGQLYVMADEFRRAGDNEKAGEALRALLMRFPDHPLTVTAAEQLSQLGPGYSAPSRCEAAAEEAKLAQGLAAAMRRIPSGDIVSRMEAELWTLDRVVAAWSRCPSAPDTGAKVRSYSAAYVQAAMRCAEISRGRQCVPQMH